MALTACTVMLAAPLVCWAQAPAPTPGGAALEAALTGTNSVTDGRWEVTLDGRIGFPVGRLKVGEFPTGNNKIGGGGTPGTLLRLHTLGVDVSEALEGSVAFYVTPRDAVRASYLYYFLDGTSTPRVSVVYNGQEFAVDAQGHAGEWLDKSRELFEEQTQRLLNAFEAGKDAMREEIRKGSTPPRA